MNTFQRIGNWLRAWSQRMPATKSDIEKLTHTMKEEVQKIVDRLIAAGDRAEKIFNEVSGELKDHAAEIADLRKQIDEGLSLEEIKTALGGLETKLGATDELIADRTAPEVPTPPADPTPADPAPATT